MSERQRELEAKRNALIAQSTRQRTELTSEADAIKERLAGIDRGVDLVRSLARKPVVIAGAIALVALFGPRRLLRVASRSAVFIATGRRLIGMFRGTAAAPSFPRIGRRRNWS